MIKKYTMWFKSYEHFHKLLMDGRADTHSDYSAEHMAKLPSLKVKVTGQGQMIYP